MPQRLLRVRARPPSGPALMADDADDAIGVAFEVRGLHFAFSERYFIE